MNEVVFELLKAKSKVRSIKTDLVFPSTVGTKKGERNLRTMFEKAVKKADVEDFRFHGLRHTFATRLVQSGKDLYQVQSLLSHKTLSMTQRYAHHYPESLREAVRVLDKRGQNSAQF